MNDDVSPAAFARPRRSLFQKYFLVLFVAVVVPLIINGASEAWFGYRDQRDNLSSRLRAEANSAAGQIRPFSTAFARKWIGRCNCLGSRVSMIVIDSTR
jgi:hypothetical protein